MSQMLSKLPLLHSVCVVNTADICGVNKYIQQNKFITWNSRKNTSSQLKTQ